MGGFLKGLFILAGLAAALAALAGAGFYWNVRAMELPVEAAREYVALEEGDKVLHAYTGVRWLDSQRYFVVQADPAGFEARIKELSKTEPGKDGAPPVPEVRAAEGPGKDLWYRTETVPSWWDVDALESAVAVDRSHGGHSGSLTIFSKQRGLIYILDR